MRSTLAKATQTGGGAEVRQTRVAVALNQLSKCALRTEILRDGRSYALGTSALYRAEERLWLVTAGHNVTGLHPDSDQPLFGNVTPDAVRIAVATPRPAGDREGLTWRPIDVALYESDFTPRWRQHPDGYGVDVVALPIDNPEPFNWHFPVNAEHEYLVEFRVLAGHDAFVLGYPEGISGGGLLPIWKRASVASEPGGDEPHLYIDTATRNGMSGGPVFAREQGFILEEGKAAKIGDPGTIVGEAYRFIGIYTGRPLTDHKGALAQLGRVFKMQVIDAILASDS